MFLIGRMFPGAFTLSSILCLFILDCQCINFMEQASQSYQGPEGSWLGFSLATFGSGSSPKLFVGAPKDNNQVLFARDNISSSGMLYECSIDLQNCAQASVDTAAPNLSNGYTLRGPANSDFYPQYVGAHMEVRAGQLLGANLITSDTLMAACAPLYTYCGPFGDYRVPVGRCLWSTDGSTFTHFSYSEDRVIQAMQAVNEPIVEDRNRRPGVSIPTYFEYGLQFGFSALSKGYPTFTATAPSSNDAKGEAYDIQDLRANSPSGTTLESNSSLTQESAYHGYTSVAGTFDSTGRRLAVSAPLARDMRGIVTVYTFEDRSDRRDPLYTLNSGDQTGAYYGAAMLAVDVNGDGRDELIVSSPLYIKLKSMGGSGQTVGRIDVYGNLPASYDPSQTILGPRAGGRFGHVLASLGDLNGDGPHDIAVADPYGGVHGQGMVYVYLGTSEAMLTTSPSQVIEASVLTPPPIGFGWSMLAQDTDSDGYTDLYVGAPSSSQVMLFMGRPILNVTGTLTASRSSLPVTPQCTGTAPGTQPPAEEETAVDINLCLQYVGRADRTQPDTVEVNATFSYDSRLKVTSHSYGLVDLQRNGGSQCSSIQLVLKNEIEDFRTSLLIGAVFEVVPPATGLSPVLEQTNVREFSQTIALVTPVCAGTDCLNSAPIINTHLSDTTYKVGDVKTISVFVNVTSHQAYLAQPIYSLTLPPGVVYRAFSDLGSCQNVRCYSETNDRVICDLGSALPPQKAAVFTVEAVFRELHPSSATVLSFQPGYSLSNSSTVALDPIPVSLEYVGSAQLQGRPEPSSTVYYHDGMTFFNDSFCGPTFSHVYSVAVNGPGRISELTVSIAWPVQGVDPSGSFSFLTAHPQISGLPLGNGSFCKVEETPLLNTCGQGSLEQSSLSLQLSAGNCSTNRRCGDIMCSLKNIDPKQVSTISIVVNATVNLPADPFTKASQSFVNDVVLFSRATLSVTAIPYALPFDGSQQTLSVNTLFPGSGHPEESPSKIEWWWIALAVVGSVLLLILIIFVLWKCSFFSRRRPGGLESEALLHKVTCQPATQSTTATPKEVPS